MVSLMTLLPSQTQRRVSEWLLNGKFEKIWKEAGHGPSGTTTETLCKSYYSYFIDVKKIGKSVRDNIKNYF
jgi:hypothetical protein